MFYKVKIKISKNELCYDGLREGSRATATCWTKYKHNIGNRYILSGKH